MSETEFKELEPIKEAPVAPAHGIAAIALNMAMKYHGITIVSDGALYQQYKLEGRNMRELHLSDVFDTAIQIERHLLGASDRIAAIVVDALDACVSDERPEGEDRGSGLSGEATPARPDEGEAEGGIRP